jgi:hypothetical protein
MLDHLSAIDLMQKQALLTDRNINNMREELGKKISNFICGPTDKCRQILMIPFKPLKFLTDYEVYKLTKCYSLSTIEDHTPINEVINTYNRLQENAAIILNSDSIDSEGKTQAIADWSKYGMLKEFWCDTIKIYKN